MVVNFVKAVHTASTTSCLSLSDALEYHCAKKRFISSHPSYRDSELSSLRKREFARLDANGGSVYLDYTGAALYPSSLVKSHYKWLKQGVAGNPHSTSPASLLSSQATDEARRALLSFFDADEREYDVIWTPNATGGFRIVGETYDWQGKQVLIPRDAHNSLNSLARKAQSRGGSFGFVEFDTASCASSPSEMDTISSQAYVEALSSTDEQNRGLIFFTGQSNITGAKLDMSLLSTAKALGWDVGLDAAALAPSTRISLREYAAVDYMVVSLYKIAGYPTGVGALIMKKSMYAKMNGKPTFFGGNIIGITMDRFEFELVEGPERFEDGTGNFASMAAVKPGLEFASRWMGKVGQRNKVLMEWLVRELDGIYYPSSETKDKSEEEKGCGGGEKLGSASFESVTLLGSKSSLSTRTPSPSRAAKAASEAVKAHELALTTASAKGISSPHFGSRNASSAVVEEKPYSRSKASSVPCASSGSRRVKLAKVGGPADLSQRGTTLPLVLTASDGSSLNYRFVIFAAAQENVSLRGGPCMCNPGASSSVMQRGLITDLEASSLLAVADVGIVRVSLGMATNFKDVWRLVRFCRKLTDHAWVAQMWNKYERQMGHMAGRLGNDIDELQARAARKRLD